MMTIVGGVYHEFCMHPNWREIYGSAGRAASALAAMDEPVELHAYFDFNSLKVLEQRAALEDFSVQPTLIQQGVEFAYSHGLASPSIYCSTCPQPPLKVTGDKIIRYGMIEGDAVVEGDYVIYDPQNAVSPKPFHDNGSRASHLALVLNRHEAAEISGVWNATSEKMAEVLASRCRAEVVVIKQGPVGALVYHNGHIANIPAYQTHQVWKIGSGDTFAAHFAYHWVSGGLPPFEAAERASKATAYYCETRGFPNAERLKAFAATPIIPSPQVKDGHKPQVYLAGPFFTLAQRWLIEQARNNLQAMGLKVFSPFHDVGHGTAEDVVQLDLDGLRHCDVVFAIGDGLDAGTIYEIGYARALGKPVILYSENESEEDKKMMQGSDCILCGDYATAIYKTLWIAISL